MGVLNATPDSFSDGGKFNRLDLAVKHINSMLENGADIIDVGGESTKPGSDPVLIDEELNRVIPIINEIKKTSNDILISVDTYKSVVAKEAIKAGADIINDISGLAFDEDMAPFLANNDIPVIIMHIKGKPKTMQQNISYNDLIDDIDEEDFVIAQANAEIEAQHEAQENQQIDTLIRQILTNEARSRLTRISLTDATRAQSIKKSLISLHQNGKFTPPMSDDQLKALLAKQSKSRHSASIRRI